MLPHMSTSWETMTSVSAGHIILTPTQPVGSGRSLKYIMLTYELALKRMTTAFYANDDVNGLLSTFHWPQLVI